MYKQHTFSQLMIENMLFWKGNDDLKETREIKYQMGKEVKWLRKDSLRILEAEEIKIAKWNKLPVGCIKRDSEDYYIES